MCGADMFDVMFFNSAAMRDSMFNEYFFESVFKVFVDELLVCRLRPRADSKMLCSACKKLGI